LHGYFNDAFLYPIASGWTRLFSLFWYETKLDNKVLNAELWNNKNRQLSRLESIQARESKESRGIPLQTYTSLCRAPIDSFVTFFLIN
jgi:hypothetical protein